MPSTAYAPESLACAAAQPNRLLSSSRSFGWTSLLLDTCEGVGASDQFETRPTPDLTLVVAIGGEHRLDVLTARRWMTAIYQSGASGLTSPFETNRMRWETRPRSQPFRTAHLYMPMASLASATEHVRRPGRSAPKPPSSLVFRDPTVAQTVLALLRGAEAGAPDLYAEQAMAWLSVHLALIDTAVVSPSEDVAPAGHLTDRRLVRAIDLMTARFDEVISLAELAAEAGVSMHHFVRLFRQKTGTTPAAHLTRLRLDTAKRLLTTTDLPTAEIAQLCGYRRSTSFATTFRRHHGSSAAEVRAHFG